MLRLSRRSLAVKFLTILPIAWLSPCISCSALYCSNALVLQLLPLAYSFASTTARRLFNLVKRKDLVQVAREALAPSALRYRAGGRSGPYLCRCITGALLHHLSDRVRLVRISQRAHEKGVYRLGHSRLDTHVARQHSILNQLAAFAVKPSLERCITLHVLEQLVVQFPATHATALRLALLKDLSLMASAALLQNSSMAMQWAYK